MILLQSGKFGKLNKPIQFPEILDLAPFTSGTSDKSPIYKLYGVVVHLDIMNASFSGHYVCYVKNNQNKWFKIDDSSVSSQIPLTCISQAIFGHVTACCFARDFHLYLSILSIGFFGLYQKISCHLPSNEKGFFFFGHFKCYCCSFLLYTPNVLRGALHF
jgi:hypothetical protein